MFASMTRGGAKPNGSPHPVVHGTFQGPPGSCNDVSAEAAKVMERPRDASPQIVTLYELHAPRAGRLAYLLTGEAYLAEDLTQEAFARLVGRIGGIRDEAAIPAYLRKSVVNLACKHRRKRGSERAYLQREGPRLLTEATFLPDLGARDELWEA
jgi:DNA-directed RNA polymerase specialized sigma24 family protein